MIKVYSTDFNHSLYRVCVNWVIKCHRLNRYIHFCLEPNEIEMNTLEMHLRRICRNNIATLLPITKYCCLVAIT